MDLSDTHEEAAFRNQAREWLQANAPKGLVDRGFSLPIDDESIKILTGWQRRLHEAGYLGLSWPVGLDNRAAGACRLTLDRADRCLLPGNGQDALNSGRAAGALSRTRPGT